MTITSRKRVHWFNIQPTILLLILLSTGLGGCGNDSLDKTAAMDLEWIKIKGGTYMMGSKDGEGNGFEHPQHKEIIKDFKVLKSEVTVAQYTECVEKGTCWINPGQNPKGCNYNHDDREDHPINCVDWYQANTFCTWIDARLPTEAEWEYMARSGGKDIEFPWGNEPADCSRAALDDGKGFNCGKWKGGTSPVCSHPKGNSAQGVCDLMGNVHEWTGDWFYPSYDKSKFNEVPKMKNGKTNEWDYHRVLRGGGIGSQAGRRARARVLHDPPFFYFGLGIRCVQ